MTRFVLRRILLLFPVVFGVTVLVFLLVHLAPGDPVTSMLGLRPRAEDVVRLRHALGLDQPLPVQYLLWLLRVAQGDLGRSLLVNQPVAEVIASRLPLTAELAVISMSIAVLIGVPLGVLSAVRRNSLLDNVGRVVAMLGVSMPVFWLGLLLIIVFSLFLGWLPAGGSPDDVGPAALVLPSITLGTAFAALIQRITRSSMLEVLEEDYIRTARAKGLPKRSVEYRHALKNALIPVVTVIGFSIGTLLSGAVLTETIFSLPGLGRLMTDAVLARDYPLVSGAVLVVAVIFVLINLAVDLIYAVLNPRIRYS